MSATVCTGVIRINVSAEISNDARMRIIDTARDVSERSGGFLVIDSAPPAIKAHLDVFGSARSDFEIMRRLKEQFDPHRTLAHGRFIGRL